MPKRRPELITTANVADRLGCDVRTVHRMVRTRRLTPVQKLPGRTGSYVFSPTDVDALLALLSERSAEVAS
jgi:Helix-turn-helix domain